MKPPVSIAGSLLLSPGTIPQQTYLRDTFLTLKPSLSPGRASLKASWCISSEFTSVVMSTGEEVAILQGLKTPFSTWPWCQYHPFCTCLGEIDLRAGQLDELWQDAVQSFQRYGCSSIAIFTRDFSSLEPRHVSSWLQHAVTIPTRNWHQRYCVAVVANFLM